MFAKILIYLLELGVRIFRMIMVKLNAVTAMMYSTCKCASCYEALGGGMILFRQM